MLRGEHDEDEEKLHTMGNGSFSHDIDGRMQRWGNGRQRIRE